MGSSPLFLQKQRRRKKRVTYEHRVAGFAVLLVAPALVVSAVFIWLQPWTSASKLMSLAALACVSFLFGAALHDHIVRPLQTLANVVGALREEDYSFRARLAVQNDALGELSLEINTLADLLAKHRTGVIETEALLQRVVEEVDIPIFAFDPANKLRLVNSAGEKLLQRPSLRLIGRASAELGLDDVLACENETLVELHFSGNARWFVRRSSFRQQGVPHTLVVLSDVSRALREEERRAWQRLIRVMGHELNNSLAPIKSIAGSLNARLSSANLDEDHRVDFERGLAIIEARAASLNRFLQAYRQLAQLPAPSLQRVGIPELVRRVAALENRVRVSVESGPEVTLLADPDQLEQMLINLLRNAADAVLESRNSPNGGKPQATADVVCAWKFADNDVLLTIEDSGSGLMNPGNVFVPFYTTKPQGSGIGLVLCRQIAEGHGGSLELANRAEQHGCIVRVRLPISQHQLYLA
jgi:two-component system, NtrC family, nitrogen regulation sensor histidine kinase NtrY